MSVRNAACIAGKATLTMLMSRVATKLPRLTATSRAWRREACMAESVLRVAEAPFYFPTDRRSMNLIIILNNLNRSLQARESTPIHFTEITPGGTSPGCAEPALPVRSGAPEGSA